MDTVGAGENQDLRGRKEGESPCRWSQDLQRPVLLQNEARRLRHLLRLDVRLPEQGAVLPFRVGAPRQQGFHQQGPRHQEATGWGLETSGDDRGSRTVRTGEDLSGVDRQGQPDGLPPGRAAEGDPRNRGGHGVDPDQHGQLRLQAGSRLPQVRGSTQRRGSHDQPLQFRTQEISFGDALGDRGGGVRQVHCFDQGVHQNLMIYCI